MRALSIAAIFGWVGSLFLPALSFRFDGEHDRVLEGYQVLGAGFYDLFVFEFSWLANFGFWLLVCRIWIWPDRIRTLRITGIITALLTAQSAELWLFQRFFQDPKPHSGYYLWAASNLLLAATAVLESPREVPRADTSCS